MLYVFDPTSEKKYYILASGVPINFSGDENNIHKTRIFFVEYNAYLRIGKKYVLYDEQMNCSKDEYSFLLCEGDKQCVLGSVVTMCTLIIIMAYKLEYLIGFLE